MRVFPLPPSAKAVAEGFTSTSAAGKSEIAAVKDELDAAEAELTEAKSELTAAEASDNEQKVANAKRDVNRVREEVESLSKSRNPAQARSDRLTPAPHFHAPKIRLPMAKRRFQETGLPEGDFLYLRG